MGYTPPAGWVEVLAGACLEVDLAHAVLESLGLRPVAQHFSTEGVFAGSVFDDCRLYVPDEEAEQARVILAQRI
ncbi:MAG: hypothetical protein ACRENM_04850 [Candidatus Dormibacteraceae bacterium]